MPPFNHLNRDMRTIKFRAWDTHRKVMIYFDNEEMWDTNWLNTEEAMQFTGLQDKNGIDIYFDDFMSNNFKTDKEVIRQVILHEGTMMLKRVKGKSSLPKYLPLYEWYQMNMVVIGNIHQDKHLIE